MTKISFSQIFGSSEPKAEPKPCVKRIPRILKPGPHRYLKPRIPTDKFSALFSN